jgi:hypothetical protein
MLMARYYFDVTQGGGTVRDEEGLDLPSSDAVRIVISRVILDIAREEISDEDASLQIDVRDDTGWVVFTGTLDFKIALH